MAKYSNQGESIECNQSSISVRKVSDKPALVNLPGRDGNILMLFKYKTNIRSIISITEELVPKQHLICDSSHLEKGDELNAAVLEVFTEKKIKFNITSNYSHVHSMQTQDINVFTYAKISIPWQFVLDKVISK